MLKPTSSRKRRIAGGRFFIVASRYNGRYVNAMVKAAQAELKRAGVPTIELVRVPGAYEIPLVAARLARTAAPKAMRPVTADLRATGGTRSGPVAIICLGVILRGETVHAAHIGEAVSRALMEIQIRYEVPVVHEVLLLENESQARARCLSKTHNRGAEAAQTALAMAQLMTRL